MTTEPPDLERHYVAGAERARLYGDDGEPRLELARSIELLERFLPRAPADVLDVGGGPGTYSAWLRERGDRVRLVDLLRVHVEEAQAAGLDAEVGDARELAAESSSLDAVLLMGPLYHLTARQDRVAALREARRVLRPGGRLLAVAISRWLVEERWADAERRERLLFAARAVEAEPSLAGLSANLLAVATT
jgi:SAM-dependent methyltransferase